VRIAPEAARALVADGGVLIDVRRQTDDSGEARRRAADHAGRMPEWISELRRDVPIVLACT
jgi:hypothetical protein